VKISLKIHFHAKIGGIKNELIAQLKAAERILLYFLVVSSFLEDLASK
jgi:hypothetical protein